MSKLNKQPIRDFMQRHYTDERLAMLLAHAQSGKLTYSSCCCFIGVLTADHALRSTSNAELFNSLNDDEDVYLAIVAHYDKARILLGAKAAEAAFLGFGDLNDSEGHRRRLLIPMIRAEMWRRAKLRKVTMAAELNQPASPIQSVPESASFPVLEQDVAK